MLLFSSVLPLRSRHPKFRHHVVIRLFSSATQVIYCLRSRNFLSVENFSHPVLPVRISTTRVFRSFQNPLGAFLLFPSPSSFSSKWSPPVCGHRSSWEGLYAFFKGLSYVCLLSSMWGINPKQSVLRFRNTLRPMALLASLSAFSSPASVSRFRFWYVGVHQ